MPKQNKFTLQEEELAQIHVAMRNDVGRVSKRASVVHSLHLGYLPPAIAQLHNISLGSVYNHFKRFKREGLTGLVDKPKSGRPPKADELYRQRLVEVIETDPSQFGLGFSIWTLPSLQAFMIRETGVSLSQHRLSEVLQDEGYVYRRPKKDLSHKHDEDLREQVKQAIVEVKKKPVMAKLGFSIWMKVESV
jgi:putative transposase